MIFLFRKIRRKLMQKNKVTTYLLYAIGEIILVVIGIFIAIQLNNLNENRKLQNKKNVYYCKLLEDVRQDQHQLERLVHETDERIYHSNKLLGLLQQEALDPLEIANEMLASVSLVTFTFKPSVSAFDDIKSSGNIGLLDEEIKEKLLAYYSNIEGIVDVVDINSDQAVRLFYDTESYSKIGWPLISFVDEAIDSSLVDKNQLVKLVRADQSYRDELISDAVYFIGSGARVKMLYENLSTDISTMEESLKLKCQN
ncbi:hypothetical protein SAMN05421640_0452 [Ekhidna lutea]|uniref:Uncharacterized protein n=2 Tax=Ekhidna lutea TaxID=447679 RepID=A0A239F2R5_EKHLU|nr:hypothetical protein SAMN05421640_0452 [Ekhidna lutea]